MLPPRLRQLKVRSCTLAATNLSKSYATAIEHVKLEHVRVPTLAWLGAAKAMKSFHGRGLGELVDVSALRDRPLLETVAIEGCPGIVDTRWNNCPRLVRLSLHGCANLETIRGLEGAKRLAAVDLSDCPSLKSIEPLRGLPRLQYVNLRGAPLGLDCSPLEGVAEIEFPYPY